ncbi:hypothetical protein NNQ27_10125 [Cronobacter dublinensis subsp. infanticibi]|uniref:hypothetical protein n=1 Tax=Cronobacter dublinensis TaxID=413497 RepID=UPI0023DD64F8|nr:hypothetical protein [Cronobacter dublinensis]WEP47222.1 hypothetical protein NNQ27_10125 [Cronobacter dublinensis]
MKSSNSKPYADILKMVLKTSAAVAFPTASLALRKQSYFLTFFCPQKMRNATKRGESLFHNGFHHKAHLRVRLIIYLEATMSLQGAQNPSKFRDEWDKNTEENS